MPPPRYPSLPGCRLARLAPPSRLSSRFLPACLPSPVYLIVSSGFPLSSRSSSRSIRLVGRLVRFPSRRPSLLACIDTAPPRPLVRSCGIHYYLPLCPPPLPPSLIAPYHDRDGNRGDETMRTRRDDDRGENKGHDTITRWMDDDMGGTMPPELAN